jgi:hypothetical protein
MTCHKSSNEMFFLMTLWRCLLLNNVHMYHINFFWHHLLTHKDLDIWSFYHYWHVHNTMFNPTSMCLISIETLLDQTTFFICVNVFHFNWTWFNLFFSHSLILVNFQSLKYNHGITFLFLIAYPIGIHEGSQIYIIPFLCNFHEFFYAFQIPTILFYCIKMK